MTGRDQPARRSRTSGAHLASSTWRANLRASYENGSPNLSSTRSSTRTASRACSTRSALHQARADTGTIADRSVSPSIARTRVRVRESRLCIFTGWSSGIADLTNEILEQRNQAGGDRGRALVEQQLDEEIDASRSDQDPAGEASTRGRSTFRAQYAGAEGGSRREGRGSSSRSSRGRRAGGRLGHGAGHGAGE